MQKIGEYISEIPQKYKAEGGLSRRDFLGLASLVGSGVAAGGIVSKLGVREAYAGEEEILTNEYTFKDTIAQSRVVFVMYNNWKLWTDNDRTQRGERFWKTLKQRFGGQADAFYKVDTGNMSRQGLRRAIDEIQENAFPSFILYKTGAVVNDGTDNDIRIRGSPTDQEDANSMLRYIIDNSFLR